MAQVTAQKQPSQFGSGLRRYRWKELNLLIVPGIILLVAMIQLLLANNMNLGTTPKVNIAHLPIGDGLIPIFGFIAATLGVHIILNIFFRKADQILFPLVSLLVGLSVIMMTRLGPDLGAPTEGSRQLMWAILSMAICIGVMFALRNISWLSRYKYSWMFFSFLLLAPSVVNGIISLKSGAPTRDSLGISSTISIQPSEFMKIGLVIFFAAYLNDNRDVLAEGSYRIGWLRLPPLRQLGPLILMLLMCLLSFLIVRELGLALLLYGLFLCMTYLATSKMSYVVVSLAAFVFFALIGYALLSYVRERFATVAFNPTPAHWTASDDTFVESPSGFQIFQGLLNLASGGVLGTGLGLGYPIKTPVIDADMVLTAFGEELGLIGLFAIIGIYLLIVHRGFRIASEAPDPFTKLLAAGLTCVFALQTLIVSAGNLKLFPLTGIPLPFLANGANSLMANFIIVGILLRISHNTAVEREGPY